jgi:hypothetical protein
VPFGNPKPAFIEIRIVFVHYWLGVTEYLSHGCLNEVGTSDICPHHCAIRTYTCIFKVCKSVHHRTIQINHQLDATIFQFIILKFIYSSTCFGLFPAHQLELSDCSGSLWFYLRIVVTVVLCSWSGRLAGRPDHEHSTTITTIRR